MTAEVMLQAYKAYGPVRRAYSTQTGKAYRLFPLKLSSYKNLWAVKKRCVMRDFRDFLSSGYDLIS